MYSRAATRGEVEAFARAVLQELETSSVEAKAPDDPSLIFRLSNAHRLAVARAQSWSGESKAAPKPKPPQRAAPAMTRASSFARLGAGAERELALQVSASVPALASPGPSRARLERMLDTYGSGPQWQERLSRLDQYNMLAKMPAAPRTERPHYVLAEVASTNARGRKHAAARRRMAEEDAAAEAALAARSSSPRHSESPRIAASGGSATCAATGLPPPTPWRFQTFQLHPPPSAPLPTRPATGIERVRRPASVGETPTQLSRAASRGGGAGFSFARAATPSTQQLLLPSQPLPRPGTAPDISLNIAPLRPGTVPDVSPTIGPSRPGTAPDVSLTIRLSPDSAASNNPSRAALGSAASSRSDGIDRGAPSSPTGGGSGAGGSVLCRSLDSWWANSFGSSPPPASSPPARPQPRGPAVKLNRRWQHSAAAGGGGSRATKRTLHSEFIPYLERTSHTAPPAASRQTCSGLLAPTSSPRLEKPATPGWRNSGT